MIFKVLQAAFEFFTKNGFKWNFSHVVLPIKQVLLYY